MAEGRVAVAIFVHGQGTSMPLAPFAELLTILDGVYVELAGSDDVPGEETVDPLMLNDADFADTEALEAFVARLDEDGVLVDIPTDGPSFPRPDVDEELLLLQHEQSWPVSIELTGGPELLLALWLLAPLDGRYTVTEEYSVDGPEETSVQKRVSFTTSASLDELVDTLQRWIETA